MDVPNSPPPSVVVRMLVLTGLVQNKDRFPGELLPPIIENREEEQLPALLFSWAGNTLPPKMHICNSCFLYIFLSSIEGSAADGIRSQDAVAPKSLFIQFVLLTIPPNVPIAGNLIQL